MLPDEETAIHMLTGVNGMNILRCKNKHYYDADTYSVCPHCGAEASGGAPPKTPGKPETGNVRKLQDQQAGQGYPNGQGGYMAGQNGYPAGQGGYAAGQNGYPAGQSYSAGQGYPVNLGGYAAGQNGNGYSMGQNSNPAGQGYPTGQTGYPAGQSYAAGQGYPTGQTGYPTGQTGYPTGQTGYPAGQTGYPTGQSGYPAGQTGYPTGQTGYPAGQGGYPAGQGGYPADSRYPDSQKKPAVPAFQDNKNNAGAPDQNAGKAEKGTFGIFGKSGKASNIPDIPKASAPSITPEPPKASGSSKMSETPKASGSSKAPVTPKASGRKEEKDITSVLTNEAERSTLTAGQAGMQGTNPAGMPGANPMGMQGTNPTGMPETNPGGRPPVNLMGIPEAKPAVDNSGSSSNNGILDDKQISLKEDPEPAQPDSLSIDSLFEMKKDDAPDNGAEQPAPNAPKDHNSLSRMVERISSSSEGRTMSYFNMASAAGERRAEQSRTPAQTPAQPKAQAAHEMPRISEYTDPVVGWLICIAGPNIGRDYRIGAGTNSIGRDGSNRIAVFGDNSISRDKHCMVIYEPKKMQFFLKAGDSTGLTYLNEEYVTDMTPLKAGDVLEIGASKFYFFPLCGDKFKWENYLN